MQFIADSQRDVFDLAELARRYGISRRTAYKWIDCYDAKGPAELVRALPHQLRISPMAQHMRAKR